MKRISVVLILMFIVSSLSAQVYRSNQLNQKLEVLEAVPQTGYALEVNGHSSVLYLDGQPVLAIDETIQGTDKIIIQTDLITGFRKTLVYQNGLLVRETTDSSDGVSETIYTYINSHLAFCTFRQDGRTIDTVFFLRSSENEEPVAVKDNSGLRFMSGSYMFQSGELYEIISSNLVLTGDYEVLENGDILVELEDGKYTYSSDGLLMKLVQGTAETINFYEDLNLIRSEKTDGKLKTVTYYENGRETEILDYDDGELVSRTVFKETGKEQTIYINGRELATVYYELDNRTVNRIEYK